MAIVKETLLTEPAESPVRRPYLTKAQQIKLTQQMVSEGKICIGPGGVVYSSPEAMRKAAEAFDENVRIRIPPDNALDLFY